MARTIQTRRVAVNRLKPFSSARVFTSAREALVALESIHMAETKVTLTLDDETHARVAGRAASDDCTIQNVVVAACREYIGERQRNRVGHVGGRPETLRGGPVEGAAEGHGPRTLEMRIGKNTCGVVEWVAGTDVPCRATAPPRSRRHAIGRV